MRVTGPMLRPDTTIRGRMSARDRFNQYEQGRLAALRGEKVDPLYARNERASPWLNGWRVGTRQRLYREACMDQKTRQLMDLVAFGWIQRDIARALRLSPKTLVKYLYGESCSRDVAARINILYEEVKKAEAWLLEETLRGATTGQPIAMRACPKKPGTGGDRPHRAAGWRAVETEGASTKPIKHKRKTTMVIYNQIE